ncbi:MAG: hypothetical protein KBD78_03990 [Oligoflexales bacterium]|nr:hypothetical protein [Oligoflexales bacterium]
MDIRILGEKKNGYWIATCLEFNLVAQGDTFEKAVIDLRDAIKGYLTTVFDTDDALSIPDLLYRPAPLYKRILFFLIVKIKEFKNFKTALEHPKFNPSSQKVFA